MFTNFTFTLHAYELLPRGLLLVDWARPDLRRSPFKYRWHRPNAIGSIKRALPYIRVKAKKKRREFPLYKGENKRVSSLSARLPATGSYNEAKWSNPTIEGQPLRIEFD